MNRLKSIKMKPGQKSSDTRLPKPPKPPEKPLMPYMRYSRKVWESVKNANPLLKLWEVGKIIGQMWRELPENEKSHFIEEYENDKIQYNDALRMYHNSPAYKSWLLHKEKVEKSLDDSDSMDGMSQSQFFKQKDRIVKDPHSVETRESYILEDNDEDPDEVFTVKHVAAQRFQRNHKFMLDLYSDFKIPELGVIVTESRMNSLKQQVSGLLMHKRKLDEEIEEWDKKHESKKLKIKLESEGFWTDYNKELEARPVITEIMFSEMVKRARDDIIREEKERDEFIKARLVASERKTSISDQSNESSSKSESNVSVEHQLPSQQTQFDSNSNQYSNNNNTPIPNPFTASVVNKISLTESQTSMGQMPSTTVTFQDSHSNMLAPSFNAMSQRSHLNSYDNRSQAMTYGYGQQTTTPSTNPTTNYPIRYPQSNLVHPQSSTPSSQSISQHSVHMSQRSHMSRTNMLSPADAGPNELDQKPPKLTKGRESHSPIIDKELHADIKNSISKDRCDASFSPPKITDSQNYPSNIAMNIKAPILSPKIEPDLKSNYHDTNEPPVTIQSPPKKPSSKKRKPPSNKSKSTTSNTQPPDLDVMNSGQIPGDNIGPNASLMNQSHISSGSKMESPYQVDPNYSQMPLQQGIYPYHYYPPQFVPHGRSPAQYGSPYQQGFSQPNYYNQIPQPYRQMTAPHQMQGEMSVNQYAMQHKSVPPNQPFPNNPYASGPYGAYNPQYPSGQVFPHTNNQQMQDQSQPMSNKDLPIPQSTSMPTHMTVPEEATKYQGDMATSCAPNAGFGNVQLGPMVPLSQYPLQYPGVGMGGAGGSGQMQYSGATTGASAVPSAVPASAAPAASVPGGTAGTTTHYPGMQSHYFYYPPAPQPPQSQSHNNPAPDHTFWSSSSSSPSSSSLSLSHGQASVPSNYPSLSSSLPGATDTNITESQPSKIPD